MLIDFTLYRRHTSATGGIEQVPCYSIGPIYQAMIMHGAVVRLGNHLYANEYWKLDTLGE